MAHRKVPSVLAKVIDWHELTGELVQLFGVQADRLGTVVQVVLEAASQGHRSGLKKASMPGRKGRKRKKVASPPVSQVKVSQAVVTKATLPKDKRPSAQARVVKVMKLGEKLHVPEIIKRILAKGWQPDSQDLRSTVHITLSQEAKKGPKGLFKRVGRGVYMLRDNPRVQALMAEPIEKTTKPEVKTLNGASTRNGLAAHA